MKTLLCCILTIVYCTNVFSQKNTFIRVFSDDGNKIVRGHLQHVTDTSVFVMTAGKKMIEIPVSKIHLLKLRRSFGHTVLITTLIAGGTLAIAGAATADPDAWIFGYSVAEGIAAGLATGVVTGVVAGSLIAGTRNRPVFKIYKNQENWQRVKDVLKRYAPVDPQGQFALKTS
ncbi:MAG TPA: hypothetical protein VFZ42_08275 [Chitinophagaceae bacterium]